MDGASSGTPAALQYHSVPEAIDPLPSSTLRRTQYYSFGDSAPGDFPLASYPSIALHLLTSCKLLPRDLAKLEATCSFFRRPANFYPDIELSISEIAALDMCQTRAVFKCMNEEERQELKTRCGGSWKLLLRFFLAGEVGSRRGKSQAIAGPGHSVAVTSKGAVYAFGANGSGQLGHGTTEDIFQPRPIRSLESVRIIQAATAINRTMLVSDTGEVYTFGKNCFSEAGVELDEMDFVATPQLVTSLKDIYVVQVALGGLFTAVLSREGRVYTFSWGDDERLGHETDLNGSSPDPLLGALENVPVVQISAGFCYLLALACEPTGMSVYSVGCGLGGKLGHGSTTDEKQPRLIDYFRLLSLEPVLISAGAWHAAVLGKDGRVCTWGWGRYGCLGHGDQQPQLVPKVVDALRRIKAVHVATGNCSTFVVSDDGEIYSFGGNESGNLGQGGEVVNASRPKAVSSLKTGSDRVVHVSMTNSVYWTSHTLALTDSGKLYAFGAGDRGQLGVELKDSLTERAEPEKVKIDL